MYKWQICPHQSTIEFNVSVGESEVVALRFNRIEDEIMAGCVMDRPAIRLRLDVNSVRRCGYLEEILLSEVCFSAVQHPFISFYAVTGCRIKPFKIQELSGILQIRNIRRPITMTVTSSAFREDHQIPNARFTLNGKINLSDFGIRFNCGIIRDEVLIAADLKLHRDIYPDGEISGINAQHFTK